MRARLAVAASGITVELREVVLRAKPVELIRASAKATVPVLALPNGSVIDQSLEIMTWALCQNDPANWLNCNNAALITQNDGQFKMALDRYKYPQRFGLQNGNDGRERGLMFLAQIEANLRHASYLGGVTPQLADIAIFPFIRQFAAVDINWFGAQSLPRLRYWLDELMRSELFETVMHRYKAWEAGDLPVMFP